ncbi:MAG TPA: GNAT family N-acetyltransferase [Steroidobacteraceae bacterium]|jgi:hypothetical protein
MQVNHESSAHRLSVELDGHVGRLDYEIDGKQMSITHVRVAAKIRGRGVAEALMRGALDHAAANGLTVKPVCAYAVAYMKKHPTQSQLEHLDQLLDEALEESFPASDAPAVGGVD